MNKVETIDFYSQKTLIAGKMKNSATKITIAFYIVAIFYRQTHLVHIFDLNF